MGDRGKRKVARLSEAKNFSSSPLRGGKPLVHPLQSPVESFSMSRQILCLALLLAFSGKASSHELPDGEIERRVQVVVKPDRVLVEYSLVMNKTTLAAQLRKGGLQPAADLSDMWKQYEKIALRSLPKDLQLDVKGAKVPVQPLRASYTGWSHRHLVCLLKADVSFDQERTKIVVTDANFPDVPGSYRIALKGRSGVNIDDASVPQLVSDAKSVYPAKLPKSKKQAALTAEGQVVRVAKGKDLATEKDSAKEQDADASRR
ncbi:MAG: hypothetical protein AAF958_05600 [Planctomycetota bacterium]